MTWLHILSLSFLIFCNSAGSTPFVLFTEPKTGTHLLIPILTSLTGKKVYWAKEYRETSAFLEKTSASFLENPNYIYFSTESPPWDKETLEKIWKITQKRGAFLHLHPPYSPTLENFLQEKGCINFFIKRDPRDQVVSLLNHYTHIELNDKSLEAIPSFDERLLIMIQRGLRKTVLNFRGWLTSPVCCVLDFHKLMGAHGGAGSDLNALEELRKIAKALCLNVSDTYLNEVYKNSFGKGWSFFKGKVGSWKDYFNEEHKKAAKEAIGDLLIELGYEKDYDW